MGYCLVLFGVWVTVETPVLRPFGTIKYTTRIGYWNIAVLGACLIAFSFGDEIIIKIFVLDLENCYRSGLMKLSNSFYDNRVESILVTHFFFFLDFENYIPRKQDNLQLDAAGEIAAELQGTPDFIIGNYSDGNLVASLLSYKMGITHCNIAHALEKTKYPDSDIFWKNFDEKYHFSCQFTTDIIAMNNADFIITSTYQEIAGSKNIVGHGHLDDRSKPILFSMARLDRVKDITGLVEAFAKCAKLRELANLVVVAGYNDVKKSKDREEIAEIEKMHELIKTHKLFRQFRWISAQTNRARNVVEELVDVKVLAMDLGPAVKEEEHRGTPGGEHSCPWCVLTRGSSALPPPLPALAPPPIVVAVEGSLEVGQPALGSVGLQEQTTPAMVASWVALPARLVEGSEAEAEEWRRLKSASVRVNTALETVKRMLSGFGDRLLAQAKAKVVALRTTQVEARQLCTSVARAREEERELYDLCFESCCLQGKASSLHAECYRARGDLDLLKDDGSRLKMALHRVKSHIELAESSLQEVEVHLVQDGSELAREHDATE
ncbi:hypothetical protein ACJX0J_027953, partial [Zea mays]